MKDIYFETIMLIERLHRLYLELIKFELDRLGIEDINNVQCLILYNIGDGHLSVGELTNRGYYLGSNVSYNLKKMVQNDYIVQEQSNHDKRSSRIRLSKKGRLLCKKMDEIITKHLTELQETGLKEENIKNIADLLRQYENYWSDILLRNVRLV